MSAVRQIQRDAPCRPLVVLLADADVPRAYQLRANNYLVKPDEFDVLLNMMEEHGRYGLTWNEPSSGRR
jgi:DNA-binding NarL/FixJ family response regulator